MAKVYSEWLPSSNYEVINAPHFSFTKMDKEKMIMPIGEVWVRLERKARPKVYGTTGASFPICLLMDALNALGTVLFASYTGRNEDAIPYICS